MRLMERGGHALSDEARWLLGELRARRLALILAVFAALLLLAAQAPLRYAIQVGQEDGPGSDLPGPVAISVAGVPPVVHRPKTVPTPDGPGQ